MPLFGSAYDTLPYRALRHTPLTDNGCAPARQAHAVLCSPRNEVGTDWIYRVFCTFEVGATRTDSPISQLALSRYFKAILPIAFASRPLARYRNMPVCELAQSGLEQRAIVRRGDHRRPRETRTRRACAATMPIAPIPTFIVRSLGVCFNNDLLNASKKDDGRNELRATVCIVPWSRRGHICVVGRRRSASCTTARDFASSTIWLRPS